MIFTSCSADGVAAFPFACSARGCCPVHAAGAVGAVRKVVCTGSFMQPWRYLFAPCSDLTVGAVGMHTPLCQRTFSVCPKALSRQKRRFAALFRGVRQIELEIVYVTDFCIRSAKFVTFFCFVSAVFGAVFCVYAVFALCAVVNKAVRRLCLRRSFVGSRRFLKVRCRHMPIFAPSV